MSYTKPGVTVRQVQNTASFPLPAPTLKSCVVGPGYYYFSSHENPSQQEIVDANYVYSGIAVTINTATLVGMADYTNLLEDSVVIDIVTAGKIVRLVKTTDFTISAGSITILLNRGGVDAFNATSKKGTIKISFLTEAKDIANVFTDISSTRDIQTYISGPNGARWFNPLAFGAQLALTNGGVATSVYGIPTATGGDAHTTYGVALEQLEVKDVYALAPMTRQSEEIKGFASHARTMSLPDNKLERISFGAPALNLSLSTPPTSNEKQTAADAVAAVGSALNNKRHFSIYPEVAWVTAYTHLATLKSTFSTAVFGSGMPAPRFLSNITLGGIDYNPGDSITATEIAAWEALIIASGSSEFRVNVAVAVPGYYLAAALAGQVAGKRPEAPLTNSGVSGFYGVYRSNEVFQQSYLDTMAEGGTWIFEGKGPNAVVTRHQLSTAATTVQTRELSITTQIDYAAKFLRDLVSPLIGKYVISDGFLKNLNAALVGGAQSLVDNGYLRDLKVTSVYQDENNPDTIRADFDLLPLYPLNYLKITLTF